jgi:hypothetical protein
MAQSEQPENWARDMVVSELQRAFPDGILPSDLQDRLGIGTSDLRIVLGALREDGTIRDDGSGEVVLNREEGKDERTAPAVEPVPTDLARELHEAAAGESGDGEDDEQPAAAPAATAEAEAHEQPDEDDPAPEYTASLLVNVEFPLPRGPYDGAPTDDQIARSLAEALRGRLRDGLGQMTPEGDVRVELVALEQLVRRPVEL